MSSSLVEDERKVAFIRETMQKSNKVTEDMVSVLSAFEERLESLEAAMLPIHNTTLDLTKAHGNIDDAIESVQKILQKFTVADDISAIIKEGIRPSNLEEFLESVNKLNQAVKYVRSNPTFRAATDRMEQLMDISRLARSACDREFERVVRLNSTPMDLSKLDPQAPFPSELHIGENAITTLRTLCKTLRSFGAKDYVQSFATARTEYLMTSLSKLDPWSICKKSYNSATERYVRRTHKFIFFIKCVLGLFKAERALASELFQGSLFDEAFEASIEPIVELIDRGVRDIMDSNPLSEKVFILLDVSHHMQMMMPEFNEATKVNTGGGMGDGKVNDDVMQCAGYLSSVSRKSFNDFHSDIQHNTVQVPVDGTVHEVTSNAMAFVRRLLGYSDVVGSVLTNQTEAASQTLTRLVEKIIFSLIGNIEEKSQLYKGRPVTHVFVLNNLTYISKGLALMASEPSVTTGALLQVSTEAHHKISSLCDSHLQMYRAASWNKLLGYLTDDVKGKPIILRPGYLPKLTRNALKEKFNGFNDELIQQYESQVKLSVPDPQLRDTLRNDSHKTILPKWKAFYDKYSSCGFTKNFDKYKKFEPPKVEEMIKHLFSTS